MSKYIIELEDDIKYLIINGRTDNRCYTLVRPVEELEILNSDYINEHYGGLQDEAYQRGHDDGYEAGCATAFKPVSDAEYQRGLEDAWVAVRKIVSMPDDPYWELFGDYKAEIIKNTTVSEVIAKLKAYEDKPSDRIEVGDEVISDTGTKFTVTAFADSDNVCGISERGLWCFNAIDKLTKTGRHFDIASILEAMRE